MDRNEEGKGRSGWATRRVPSQPPWPALQRTLAAFATEGLDSRAPTAFAAEEPIVVTGMDLSSLRCRGHQPLSPLRQPNHHHCGPLESGTLLCTAPQKGAAIGLPQNMGNQHPQMSACPEPESGSCSA
uniref:Uncharacterized protein n=1 Tax=Rousettus aegyptiacus TaxID=9407 RepID=A0A7J8F0Q1_ROUAE|nr:hypothetical protein HJG63_012204 [Rousettus aegyptiacus]